MVDALASKSEEGRGMAALSVGEMPNNRYIPRCPNEETHLLTAGTLVRGSVPSEVKHHISWRKRKQKTGLSFWLENRMDSSVRFTITTRKKVLAMPLVAASEKGRAQTIRVYMNGVVGQERHLVEKSHQLV